MKRSAQFFALIALLAIFSLFLVPPASAFDGRSGEKIVIGADETIEDDVYVNANEFVLDGTVKGDLIVFGAFITINGTVEGDVIAAGQTVVINGKVGDDVRIAGAVLQIGDQASIGGDLVSAGASLETRAGSVVSDELVVAAGQTLLAGDVTGDVSAGTGALELRGKFGGDVSAEVGDPDGDAGGPPMSMFFPQNTIAVPNVMPGLTISPDAVIAGNLEYTQSRDVRVPNGAVGGKVTRHEPVVASAPAEVKPTPMEAALKWTFDLVRSAVTLILLGLLLGWLLPAWTGALVGKMQSKPGASLGWGVVAYAAFFFALFVTLVAMLVGGILFGALTLGGVSGIFVWGGIFAIFALIFGFVLLTSFVAKILVAWLGGKWLVKFINPALADNRFIPLIIGVILLALLMALPYIGWVFKWVSVFAGLGALWLWGSERWQARKVVAIQ